MSTLLKAYSQYCDVEPGTVEFPSTFIPLPDTPYITVCTGSCRQAGIYDYFQKVLSLINLGYQIVQIGAVQDYPIPTTIDYRGRAQLRQETFILENSLLHIGNEHVFNHIAASKGIPVIGLYSILPANCTAPSNTIAIEPNRVGKPSYDNAEFPKSINNIFPEVVAEQIANVLKKPYDRITTIRIGQFYLKEQVDLIPDFAIPLDIFRGRRIICRYDLCPNKEGLIHFLQAYGGVISTADPIDPQILHQLKSRIPQILYYLDKNYSLDFIKVLHCSGIPYELITEKTGKELSQLKLELFDFNQIKGRNIPNIDGVTSDMYFDSNRVFFSRNEFYPTAWHWSEGIPSHRSENKIGAALSSKKFLDSWDHLYIFTK